MWKGQSLLFFVFFFVVEFGKLEHVGEFVCVREFINAQEILLFESYYLDIDLGRVSHTKYSNSFLLCSLDKVFCGNVNQFDENNERLNSLGYY